MSTEEVVSCKQKVQVTHRLEVTRALTKITEMLSTTGERGLHMSQLKQKQAALLEKSEILKKLDSELLESVPDDEL